MRWINTNAVKCVSHEVDGHKHCQMSSGHEMDWQKQTSESPPPPPPPRHIVTRALHILITPTEQTSYPETWTKLQLMHQRILLTKEYMNKRLITTVDNKTGRKWRQMLFGDERQHKKIITTYLFSAHKKSCSVSSTCKRSKEEVTYNSPDVK